VNSPPPPARQAVLFERVYGEAELVVPGHAELINVLWEMGALPDVRVLPLAVNPLETAKSREAAIDGTVARFRSEQWALWPLEESLSRRVKQYLADNFDDFFTAGVDGFAPRLFESGREILITWQPQRTA
jgi:hypothetical protein